MRFLPPGVERDCNEWLRAVFWDDPGSGNGAGGAHRELVRSRPPACGMFLNPMTSARFDSL